MIGFKPASIEDLSLLRHWDEEPHIIAAKGEEDWEWETELLRNPDWREQFIAYIDEKPIGFIEIIDPILEDSHYWGNMVVPDCTFDPKAGLIENSLRAIDIWIGEADCLNQGFGTEMMRWAIERCFALPSVNAILVDPFVSNKRAHRFYERFGFRFVEIRRFGDDVCAVYRLERNVWTEKYRNE